MHWTDRNGGQLWTTSLLDETHFVLWDIATEANTPLRLQDVDLDSTTGTLYIADWGVSGRTNINEGRILSIDKLGNKTTIWAGQDGYHYLALDPSNQVIYYTHGVSYLGSPDMDVGKVNYDGSNNITLRYGSGEAGWFPSGIALDELNSRVYWGAPGLLGRFYTLGPVNVMDTNGSNVEALVPYTILHGRGLALDPVKGLVFYTSHAIIQMPPSTVEMDPARGPFNGGLYVYNIGANTTTALIDDPDTAYTDVEIEINRQRVWWADFGRNQTWSAAYDDQGTLTDVKVEIVLPGRPFGIALEY